MMLDQIFQDRDNWKKDTFESIKKNLISVKDNRFVQYNQTNGVHLVCVYGKSQVGKTTLILNMIGLKDDVCKKEVANVLRGGIAHGNSSTSTAIIYTQSDSDQYGLCIETLEGKKITENINCSAEEMILQLQSIREKVEKNEFSGNGILHIAIPKSFFLESLSKEKISILDLPGVESCNIKEKLHVRSLMNRYIPLSSVCIITCPASTIQSLEKEELPNNIDWKYFPHKYIVVLTRAYSDGSIKSYFLKPKKQRTEKFEKFLTDRYKAEFTKILGANNDAEIYPIDVGDSFEMLLTNELTNDADRNEARITRDSILNALQTSIIKHKGEQLLSSIRELRTIVERSDESEIEELNDKISSKYSELSEKITELSRHEDTLKDLNEKVQSINESLTKLGDYKTKVEELTKEISKFSQDLITAVKSEIKEKSLIKEKNGKTYFYDKEKHVLSKISSYLNSNLWSSILEKAQNIMQENGIIIDFYSDKIASEIYSQYVESYSDKLYPRGGIIDSLFKDCKVTLSTAEIYIKQIQSKILDVIQTTVVSKCKEKLDERIKEKEEELSKYEKAAKREESKINEIKQKKQKIEKEIADNNEQIKNVKLQKKTDNDTLDMYLKFAKDAYLYQKNEVIKKINSNINPVEKTSYLLLLGIINKDYRSLVSAANE